MYLATSLLLACGLAADRPFTPLVPLQGKDTCSRCAGWLLPGTIIERSDVPLRIDSDLPELFRGEGVFSPTFVAHRDATGTVPLVTPYSESPAAGVHANGPRFAWSPLDGADFTPSSSP